MIVTRFTRMITTDEIIPAVAKSSSLQIEMPMRMKLKRAKIISMHKIMAKAMPILLKRLYDSVLEKSR